MSEHRLDLISLFGGVVFASFGVVGLLQAAGWIDGRAPLWVGVGIAAVLGLAGIAGSLNAALREATTDDHDPLTLDDLGRPETVTPGS